MAFNNGDTLTAHLLVPQAMRARRHPHPSYKRKHKNTLKSMALHSMSKKDNLAFTKNK